MAAGAVSDLGMLGAGTKCASPNSLRAANLLAGFATGGSISSTKDDLNRRTLANGAEPKPRRQSSLVVCAAGEPVCENPVVWDPAGRESPPMDPAAAVAAKALAAVQEAVTVAREQDNLVTRDGKRVRKISKEPSPPQHKRVCAVQSVQPTPPAIVVIHAQPERVVAHAPPEPIRPPPPVQMSMQPRLPQLPQLPQLPPQLPQFPHVRQLPPHMPLPHLQQVASVPSLHGPIHTPNQLSVSSTPPQMAPMHPFLAAHATAYSAYSAVPTSAAYAAAHSYAAQYEMMNAWVAAVDETRRVAVNAADVLQPFSRAAAEAAFPVASPVAAPVAAPIAAPVAALPVPPEMPTPFPNGGGVLERGLRRHLKATGPTRPCVHRMPVSPPSAAVERMGNICSATFATDSAQYAFGRVPMGSALHFGQGACA